MKQKLKNFEILEILESTVGIKVSVILCISMILSSVCLHCYTIKWFFEDIVPHLFHFLDEDHVHENCTMAIFNFNQTQSLISNKTLFNVTHLDEFSHSHLNFTLFKSIPLLKTFELLTNFIYFFYLILCVGLMAKFKFGFGKKTHNLELQRANSKNQKTQFNFNFESLFSYCFTGDLSISKRRMIFKLLEYILFYSLLFLILFLSVSASELQLKITCEVFFKNGINVSLKYSRVL